jgi:hypothetical protein
MSSLKQSIRVACQNKFKKLQLLGAAVVLGISAGSAVAAGFTTNFQPDGPTVWNGDNTGYCTYGNCTSHVGNADPTPFGLTLVTIDNVLYFHTIVGDPATGFAIESYTRASPGAAGFSNNTISNLGGHFSQDGGGNELLTINTQVSGTPTDLLTTGLNMANSLGQYQVSGTGSMNPNYTVFRMVMTDPAGGMSMEVYKPYLDKKPRISQTIQDGTMSSVFVTDERSLGYNDSSTAAPVVNNLVINEPNLPTSGAADFEMALAQAPDVTAGRFTYTPGLGWQNPLNDPTLGWNTPGSYFDQGSYQYVGGQGFNPLTFNWASVFNYADNPGCSAVPTGKNAVVREQVGLFGGSCFNKP